MLYNGACIADCPARPDVIEVGDSLCLDCPDSSANIDPRGILETLKKCNIALDSTTDTNNVCNSIEQRYQTIQREFGHDLSLMSDNLI